MIRFGPLGWRGVFAEEITVASVRRLAAAVALHLRATKGAGRGVLVGHDARFLSARLATEAGAALAAQGVRAYVAKSALPTAACARAVVAGRRALGMVLTAGAGPSEIGGVLLIGPDGAPAGDPLLRAIERQAAAAGGATTPGRPRRPVRRAAVVAIDPWPAYTRHLAGAARRVRAPRGRLRIACDARRGAAAGRMATALAPVARAVARLNDTPHPAFAPGGPDCAEPQLAALTRAVRQEACALGIAVDADGGRFGIIDRGGRPVPVNLILALLADWLLERGAAPGGVARTAATTHLIDDIARRHDRQLLETPVGFDHLAPLLLDGRAGLACEEEGGFALAAHLPLRDGLLAALLVVAMTAARRVSLVQQTHDLFARVGPRHGRRIDYHVDAQTRARMVRRLTDPPTAIAGRRVRAVDVPDGPRVTFENGAWLLVRDATHDQVARCHIETRTRADLEALTTGARELLGRA